MKKTLCIYHGNCRDGFTAAWVVKRSLGENVQFVAAQYGDKPPAITADYLDVLIVDFSWPADVLYEMAAKVRSVIVLDHHKTAEAALAGVPRLTRSIHEAWEEATYANEEDEPFVRVLFDMGRSGAALAWDLLFPALSPKPRPPLIDYVQDNDLYRFDLPRSREIGAAIGSYDFTFSEWDRLHDALEQPLGWAHACEAGHHILRARNKDVAELVEACRTTMVIGGVKVPVANIPYNLASSAAGRMAEEPGVPFAATYFDKAGGRVFSLRSRGQDGADVSEVAKLYGGGGHRNAAGFNVPHGWRGDETASEERPNSDVSDNSDAAEPKKKRARPRKGEAS